MGILEQILEQKRKEVSAARLTLPMEELRERAASVSGIRPFPDALNRNGFAVIAEIKKASPSKGLLAEEFDPVVFATEYERGGARALSVLTDRCFFQGDVRFIAAIKKATNLPILRKDFIIDEYQLYESKLIGADAILLIVRALDVDSLDWLAECAKSIGLSVLFETHTKEEIDIANSLHADMIGINNRDLTTFDVSLQRSLELRQFIPPAVLAVSESGIRTHNDVAQLKAAGFDAILVGEGLVTRSDKVSALKELIED
ncbi:MAG TPA: indole-3-glycerol phosphate synthase TrpC [Bacteroidetes bacterium]|nr:indole-3-glycerol phosphate synthase TrpC [Bacteroidota bacterium]